MAETIRECKNGKIYIAIKKYSDCDTQCIMSIYKKGEGEEVEAEGETVAEGAKGTVAETEEGEGAKGTVAEEKQKVTDTELVSIYFDLSEANFLNTDLYLLFNFLYNVYVITNKEAPVSEGEESQSTLAYDIQSLILNPKYTSILKKIENVGDNIYEYINGIKTKIIELNNQPRTLTVPPSENPRKAGIMNNFYSRNSKVADSNTNSKQDTPNTPSLIKRANNLATATKNAVVNLIPKKDKSSSTSTLGGSSKTRAKRNRSRIRKTRKMSQ